VLARALHLERVNRDMAPARAVLDQALADEERRHRKPKSNLERLDRAFGSHPRSQRHSFVRTDSKGKQLPDLTVTASHNRSGLHEPGPDLSQTLEHALRL